MSGQPGNGVFSNSTGNIYGPPTLSSLFERAGCQDFKVHIWNYIYHISSDKHKKPLSPYAMKEEITEKLSHLTKDISSEDIEKFSTRFVALYTLVDEFLEQHQEEDNTTTLVQFEHGVVPQDYTTFAEQLKVQLSELDQAAKTFNTDCPVGSSRGKYDNNSRYGDIQWFNDMKQNKHPLVYGAKKVMATAYQSCSVLDLPLMNSEHETVGVRKSKQSGNRGYKRNISNLNQVNQSHYYLSQLQAPSHPQCLNIHASPLLYDYGGKPSTSTYSINLFQNSGSGSQMLGIDCSGFVSTAMATAGLRLKEGMSIRPVHVQGINSWMLKNSRKNELSCLEKQDISVKNPLQPGDIIASNNHVVIVDMVDENEDSFSITPINSQNDCHSSRIQLQRLNFSIIQSSVHNNSVGINRMHIVESLSAMNNAFNKGLKKIVSRACYKMFGKETHKNIDEISILRHTIHEPSCRDQEIYLERQECLQSCEPSFI